MRKTRFASAGLLVSLILFSAARADAQKPGGACCAIVSWNANTGVATAKVNATGNVFEFKAIGGLRSNLGSVTSLKVGQAVYANFTNQQVSLDGRRVCCTILGAAWVAQNAVRLHDSENFWTTMAPMSATRSGAVGGVVKGVLYVAGGSGNHSSLVEAYDPSTNTWTTKGPPPTMASPRMDVAGGAVNGILYVVGGVASSANKVATVEAYDPATNTWTTKAPMPTARSNATAAVVNGILYVVGGVVQNGVPVDYVEAYDPATNTWRSKPRIVDGTGNTVSPASRYGAAAAVMNGILYVVGGVTTSYGDFYVLPTVQAYDPATNLWTRRADMTTARARPTAAVVNGILYVVGGVDGLRKDIATVEAYNPATNAWTKIARTLSARTGPMAPMPTARYGAAFGVVNGILYVVGGSVSGGEVATLEAYHP